VEGAPALPPERRGAPLKCSAAALGPRLTLIWSMYRGDLWKLGCNKHNIITGAICTVRPITLFWTAAYASNRFRTPEATVSLALASTPSSLRPANSEPDVRPSRTSRAPMPQPLSTREANLFRTVIRHYEDKQYKRGLKAAEQILRKNPKHADTMSMKALIMNAQGKTEEAFALAKEALTIDMKSHICWHVYGILYRTNKNFDEAIKAYKFALKLEPDSQQIQRDLAILQIQMRDYQGYVQSRFVMLKARPHMRQNWTALAVAYHLEGNLQQAEHILTTFEKSVTTTPPRMDLENSEAVLYKNTVIAEQGDIVRALEHLEAEGKASLDRLAVMELRARYLAQLGRKEDAAKAYRALLDRNSEHQDYYRGLTDALGIRDGDESALNAVYDEYATKHPRCDAARRLPLDFLTGRYLVPPVASGRMLILAHRRIFPHGCKNVPERNVRQRCTLYLCEFKTPIRGPVQEVNSSSPG